MIHDQVRRRCAALNVIVAGHPGGHDADAVMQIRILCHSLRGLLKDEASLQRIAPSKAMPRSISRASRTVRSCAG